MTAGAKNDDKHKEARINREVTLMCKDCGCGEDNGVVTKVFTRVPGMMQQP